VVETDGLELLFRDFHLAGIAGSRWRIEERAGQGRGRAGSLPCAVLASLVRPHHLYPCSRGLAVSRPGQGGKRGTGANDPGMIGYTLLEIGRLLTSLVQCCMPDPAASGPGPLATTTPGPSPAMPLPAPRLPTNLKCRCSVRCESKML
jgi:hypothetical protein